MSVAEQTGEEERNLAVVVANDPTMKKHYFSKLQDPSWRVPGEYEDEILDLLKTPVALIPSITSPEDYKVLVSALQIVTGCKSRIAIITHHVRALHYRWSKLLRKATRYTERTYYKDLNSVKDSIRKAILSSALEPLEEGLQQVKHLLDLAELAQNHLNDINWSVKHSCDMVSSYFQTIRQVTPQMKDL